MRQIAKHVRELSIRESYPKHEREKAKQEKEG